ncbi:MAG: lytic murein transglycosylase [Desulfobacteraceae bacterium]|nr:lytic murein transglycosylase [Desulfobacteraceae bacterium]
MFKHRGTFRFRIYVIAGLLMVSATLPAGVLTAGQSETFFTEIRKRLVSDGFDAIWIDQLYENEAVAFEGKGVSQYFMLNEARLNYKQFTSDKSIAKARDYLVQHRSFFEDAQKKFGVDPEVIAAIMLVETRLGNFVGRRNIINTLSTIAALSSSNPREQIWENIPQSKRISRKDFDKKADFRSKWAYKELKAFLTYTRRESMDPLVIKGSIAGAMGIAQFMPTNILTLARDGNRDGRIDLFDHADAIFSIANYLKRYGWRPGISREKAAKVVYSYNHSSYYVDTVLEISDLLKG